jgi:hypothetical protein
MYRGPGAIPAVGGAALKASQPVRLFTVQLNDITNDDFLKLAKPIGWRYLIVDSGPIAVADVKDLGSGGAAFSSVTRGPIAEGLSKAADLATRRYDKDPVNYEVRILEIPSLYISALWLHGSSREVFFPFLAGGGVNPIIVREDPQFVQHVLQAAAVKQQWR